MSPSPRIPVILSGGAGTRLWPVSRKSLPKPFMAMPDGETLLGKTLLRALRGANGTDRVAILRTLISHLSSPVSQTAICVVRLPGSMW